jgi:hypothetical protein
MAASPSRELLKPLFSKWRNKIVRKSVKSESPKEGTVKVLFFRTFGLRDLPDLIQQKKPFTAIVNGLNYFLAHER